MEKENKKNEINVKVGTNTKTDVELEEAKENPESCRNELDI
jgi:hypothetical protein